MPKSLLHILICLLLFSAPCFGAEVLIIADAQLKPVREITQGMRKTMRASTSSYAPEEVRGKLAAVVRQEGARVVVALGREALTEAAALPPHIPLVYGMVATPPSITRPNSSGYYMATPAAEYVELIRTQLPVIRKILVVASREMLNSLAHTSAPAVYAHAVRNPFEFTMTLKRQEPADALLLLPDSRIMTAAAIEESYLYSFRRQVPLLGISERHVREGALLALVVDMPQLGRDLGELVNRALKNGTIGQLSLPPRRFELFLNMDTARRMRIRISPELERMARKVYP